MFRRKVWIEAYGGRRYKIAPFHQHPYLADHLTAEWAGDLVILHPDNSTTDSCNFIGRWGFVGEMATCCKCDK